MTARRLTMAEWQQCEPKSEAALRGLFLEQSELAALAAELTRTGKLSVVEQRQGVAISTTSFVGKITLGPLELTIQPKLSGLSMLTLLRYAFGLRQITIGEHVTYNTSERAFQELLALQLAAEAEELLLRGLHRTYRSQSETLAVPRGRIDMQRLAHRAGAPTLDLPCIWHPRSEDCLPNQILRQGLLVAAHLSEDTALCGRLRRLAAILDGVTTIELDWRCIRRYRGEANRLIAAYDPAITLIALLLEAQGAALEQGQESLRLPGFLFDMNRLFEALIGRLLRENLDGYVVQEQYGLRGLFAYEPEHNPRHRMPPTPRPDYIVTSANKPIALLDAKYRDLWTHDLPRDMLYQLAIYALSREAANQATILYPTLNKTAREARIQITHPLHQIPTGRVVLRPVPMDYLAALLEQRETSAARRERVAFAKQLAFGHDQLSS